MANRRNARAKTVVISQIGSTCAAIIRIIFLEPRCERMQILYRI